MPWPPAVVSRRVALLIYGLALMLYLTLTGLFFYLGFDPRATVILAQVTGLLGLSVWLTRLLRLRLAEALALRPAAPVHWQMVLGAAIPLQALGGALQFAVLRELPDDSVWRQAMEESIGRFVAVESGLDLAMLFLAAVVTAAICEEALFRGLLLQLLRRRAGWISAIVWSASLFAIFHLNPIALLPVGLVGAYLAVLVWRSGSLYPAILAHALNNGLALFGLPLLLDEAAYSRFMWPILTASAVLFGAIFTAYIAKTTPPTDGPPPPWAGLPGETHPAGESEARRNASGCPQPGDR